MATRTCRDRPIPQFAHKRRDLYAVVRELGSTYARHQLPIALPHRANKYTRFVNPKPQFYVNFSSQPIDDSNLVALNGLRNAHNNDTAFLSFDYKDYITLLFCPVPRVGGIKR